MNFFKSKALLLLIFSAMALMSCSTDTLDLQTTQGLQTTQDSDNLHSELEAGKPIEIEILDVINNYRVSIGLNMVSELNAIKCETLSHTEYMISVNEMSHDNFEIREYNLEKNTSAKSVSEIVAYGFDNAEAVVNAWLKSESHKKTIEGNYTDFNVSAEKNEKGLYYFTCIFIRL